MKLLPLDCPELIELVADWLSKEENYKWLDFGNGVHSLTAISLKVMTQRDLHVLRAFTPDESDLPIGVVGLSNVDRRFKTASSLWAVLGRKRYGGYAPRASSKLLTWAFTELALESVGAWTVEINGPGRRGLEQLGFHYIGRQRRCHWIDGQPYDRLLYDLLATEHREIPDD
jgi:RimJ/RimL family protein N-acetyltransferase